LSRSSDGVELQKYLEAELQTTTDQLIDAPDGQRYLRLQGRAKLLKEFLELLRVAPDAHHKLSNAPTAMRPARRNDGFAQTGSKAGGSG
jgi:hypothetical protein